MSETSTPKNTACGCQNCTDKPKAADSRSGFARIPRATPPLGMSRYEWRMMRSAELKQICGMPQEAAEIVANFEFDANDRQRAAEALGEPDAACQCPGCQMGRALGAMFEEGDMQAAAGDELTAQTEVAPRIPQLTQDQVAGELARIWNAKLSADLRGGIIASFTLDELTHTINEIFTSVLGAEQ
jgi:hypothetical protein